MSVPPLDERLSRRQLLTRGVWTAAVLAGVTGGGAASERDPRSVSTRPQKERVPRMHLGIVTYNVARDWDFDTLLRICREAGLEGVEFRTTHAHGVEPTLDAARRAEIRQKCADAGLRQISLGTVCEFHSPDLDVVNQNIRTCKEFVLLAKDIGARGVKVRPNGLPPEVPAEKTLAQIGKALAECGRFGEAHGVEIWLEVHGKDTSIPANCRRIMEACDHKNVGVTWNSNSTDVVNGSVRESFALLQPFIRCCHITELWSDYPYRELFGLLKASGYDRFTLCEVGTPVRAEDGAIFLKCYKGLWKELQR